MKHYKFPPVEAIPADEVLARVLDHIGVPAAVLTEARARRDRVLAIAKSHPARRGQWFSGSIAHGTDISPLGDADCGAMIDRRPAEYQRFGPDAPGGGARPEEFFQEMADWIEERIGEEYPNATIDRSGNRAIKVIFDEPIDDDELGTVDPTVDLILGLERRDGPGIWIPNRREESWDASHPQRHTDLMLAGGDQLVVARAHLVRLAKRAIRRDAEEFGLAVLCSWNVSALALEFVDDQLPLSEGLADLFGYMADSIAQAPTEDPAGVADPIKLPDGMTEDEAARRLALMRDVVIRSRSAVSTREAEDVLLELFGIEIKEIREAAKKLNSNDLTDALQRGEHASVAAVLAAPSSFKPTRSYADRS